MHSYHFWPQLRSTTNNLWRKSIDTFCINLGTPMYSKPEHELEGVENRIARLIK